jgi:secreted Zn-dependent insulinase-like peptidase
MAEQVTKGADKNQEGLLTQEEFDKKLQSETDKRVQEALNTAEKKWEEKYNKKLEEVKTEAERLAKLSADEKKAEEDKKRAKELADKDRELTLRELNLGAIDELDKRKLPVSFAKFLLKETAEKTLENITSFETAFREAVQAEVDAKLKGKTPEKGGGTDFDFNKFIRG